MRCDVPQAEEVKLKEQYGAEEGQGDQLRQLYVQQLNESRAIVRRAGVKQLPNTLGNRRAA